MLTKLEHRLFLLATILLGAAFALPLWEIEIWAPQYPEGLSMRIGISRLAGNISQINILNHYIGMKAITPESIPELSILPLALGGLVGLALLAWLLRRRWAVTAWTILFSIVGAAGMVDFYRWGYDYGHNLNPEAPIKVPGMTYQPPLFGHKTILNIDAYSYPDWGGIALALAGALAAYVAFGPLLVPRILKLLKDKKAAAASLVIALGIGLSGASGCTTRPEPLVPGTDLCGHCRMTISDARYGGEVLTRKGRVQKFDALPCLLRYANANRESISAILVSDFFRPGTLIDVREAAFIRSREIRGPMGQDIAASADSASIQQLRQETSGEIVKWDALLGSFSVSSR